MCFVDLCIRYHCSLSLFIYFVMRYILLSCLCVRPLFLRCVSDLFFSSCLYCFRYGFCRACVMRVLFHFCLASHVRCFCLAVFIPCVLRYSACLPLFRVPLCVSQVCPSFCFILLWRSVVIYVRPCFFLSPLMSLFLSCVCPHGVLLFFFLTFFLYLAIAFRSISLPSFLTPFFICVFILSFCISFFFVPLCIDFVLPSFFMCEFIGLLTHLPMFICLVVSFIHLYYTLAFSLSVSFVPLFFLHAFLYLFCRPLCLSFCPSCVFPSFVLSHFPALFLLFPLALFISCFVVPFLLSLFVHCLISFLSACSLLLISFIFLSVCIYVSPCSWLFLLVSSYGVCLFACLFPTVVLSCFMCRYSVHACVRHPCRSHAISLVIIYNAFILPSFLHSLLVLCIVRSFRLPFFRSVFIPPSRYACLS